MSETGHFSCFQVHMRFPNGLPDKEVWASIMGAYLPYVPFDKAWGLIIRESGQAHDIASHPWDVYIES